MTAFVIAVELTVAVLLSAAIAGALAWYTDEPLTRILTGKWRR